MSAPTDLPRANSTSSTASNYSTGSSSSDGIGKPATETQAQKRRRDDEDEVGGGDSASTSAAATATATPAPPTPTVGEVHAADDEEEDDGDAHVVTSVHGFNIINGEEHFLVEWSNTGWCTWEPYVYVHCSPLVRTYRRKMIGGGKFKDTVFNNLPALLSQSGGAAAANAASSSTTASADEADNEIETTLPAWIKDLPSSVKIEVHRDRETRKIEGIRSLHLVSKYLPKCVTSKEAVKKLESRLCVRDVVCGCSRNEKTGALTSHAYDSRGHLRPEYIEYDIVYECTSQCGCGPNCPSRIVQANNPISVCLLYTESCGWGVRSEQDIPKGTFVIEYTGEIVTAEQADERGLDTPSRTYLFDLSGKDFVIDATRKGNFSRCEPNLKAYVVHTSELDKRINHIAFFTLRDIRRGEELTFNYKPNQENYAPSSSTIWLRCMCGKPSCKKFVFFYS